jgi:hypothetical protein
MLLPVLNVRDQPVIQPEFMDDDIAVPGTVLNLDVERVCLDPHVCQHVLSVMPGAEERPYNRETALKSANPRTWVTLFRC